MQLKSLILVSFIVFFSLPSLAVKEIVFRKQTQVYATQNENSEVIGVYERNDTIPISATKYGAWRKVIVEVDGHKKLGWILVKDVKGSRIKESAEIISNRQDAAGVVPLYHLKNGFGFMGAMGYIRQGSGNIDINTGVTVLNAEYGSITGTNFYFGIFGDIALSKTRALRLYLLQRKLDRSGNATIKNNPTGSFSINQDVLSLGATYKFYSNPQSIFWWGAGLEVGKTSTMTVTGSTASGPITFDAATKPTYAMVTGSAGYDFNLSGNFYFLPEGRIGLVPNGSPFIMTVELLFPFSYSF